MNKYLLIIGASLMLLNVSSSNAFIIYSGVKNISFTATEPNEPNNLYFLNIDLADDAIGTWDNIQFEMIYNSRQLGGSQTSWGESPAILAYETNYPYIEKYSYGDKMTGQFGSGSFILFNDSDAGGLFINTTGYAGLLLGDFDGQRYFGWMQLSVDFDPGNVNIGPTITLIDWAYSDEPGLPILVGAVPVPEPSTMILFGTGLVGVVGSRLRRKKK